jgi:hypothetical protein
VSKKPRDEGAEPLIKLEESVADLGHLKMNPTDFEISVDFTTKLKITLWWNVITLFYNEYNIK